MKPSQGLLIVAIGFVIATLSMAPICLSHFAPDAAGAVVDEWGTRTVLLYFGFLSLLIGHIIMAIGVLMTAVGVFTK